MATLNISPISFSDADLTDKKQLKKIENYLYQMTEQLRFTLNNLSLDDLGDLKGAIDGEMLKNGSIGDDKLYSRFILADTVHAKYATIEKLIADDGYLKDLRADVLNAKTAVFGDLETNGLQADVANIGSILAGNIGTGSLQTLVINSTNATIANATIKSAMIDSISTSDVEIASDDGNLQIIDNTIQIKDSTRVRVQLGKDAAGDYNLYVWDTDGNLMFDAAGLHPDGIKEAIIRDDMVAADADISAAKIFVEDGEGGETLATTISVMNGYLESIISSTDIADFGEGETFYTRYSSLKQSYDSFSSTVSSSITDLDDRMDTAESTITQLADDIELKVSADGVISAINLSTEGVKIQGNRVDILGNTVFSSLIDTEGGQTVIDGSKIKTGSITADDISAGRFSGSTNPWGYIDLDTGEFSLSFAKLYGDESGNIVAIGNLNSQGFSYEDMMSTGRFGVLATGLNTKVTDDGMYIPTYTVTNELRFMDFEGAIPGGIGSDITTASISQTTSFQEGYAPGGFSPLNIYSPYGVELNGGTRGVTINGEELMTAREIYPWNETGVTSGRLYVTPSTDYFSHFLVTYSIGGTALETQIVENYSDHRYFYLKTINLANGPSTSTSHAIYEARLQIYSTYFEFDYNRGVQVGDGAYSASPLEDQIIIKRIVGLKLKLG